MKTDVQKATIQANNVRTMQKLQVLGQPVINEPRVTQQQQIPIIIVH